MRPLRRRPKQLTEQPTLYEPSRGGGGMALVSGDRRRTRTAATRAGGTASGTTDEPADLITLADLPTESGADQLTRARARQIARRLSVPRPPRDQRSRRGVGELARDSLAVVAFWSDAAVLVRMGEQVAPLAILDLLLRVPSQGLTNVSFALETAGHQLAGVPPRDARVLLLSDCVHNAGPDPRLTAARLPRLDVLVDTSGEQDVDLGRDLARIGRGRARLVRDHRDVAAALSAAFSD